MNPRICLIAPIFFFAFAPFACAQTAPAPVKAAPAKLKAAPKAATLDDLDVAITTGETVRFITPAALQAGGTVTLTLRNPTATALNGQLSLAVKDRADAAVELVDIGSITIAAQGETDHALTAAQIGADVGIKYVDWQIKSGEQTVEGRASFAVVDPVGISAMAPLGDEQFIFGNAGVRNFWSAREKTQVYQAAALVGAQSVRCGTAWREIQPTPDAYKWEGLDETVELAAKQGLRVQLLVAYGGASWTKSPETLAIIKESKDEKQQWRYPPRADLWRVWMRALATRYKESVSHYEIWNEPDLEFFKGTPAQYHELLRIANEEIHAVNPDAIVISGGIAGMDLRDYNPEVLPGILEQGHFDRVGYHRHGTFARLASEIDNRVLPMMKKYGVTKPLYFTETAMGSTYSAEFKQAVELPKRLAFVWSRGATGYHYFTIWDKPQTGRKSSGKGDGSDKNYTMLRGDFAPRAVWVAYNEMSRVLRGRRFERQLDIGEGRWAFAFQGKGDFSGTGANSRALVAWNEDPLLADAPLVFNIGDGATARVVDLMGNAQTLPASAGRVVWNVGREPSYLVIEGAPQLQLEGALLTVQRPPALVPGGAVTLRATLRNPLATTQTARVSWQVPAPLQARGPLTVEQELQPGAQFEATLTVSAPANLSAQSQSAPAVIAELVGTELRAQSALVLPLAVKSGGADFNRAPDFDLRSESDIVNNNAADPTTSYLTWQGPQDLSARAWVGRDGEDLTMRFEVRDDAHFQPYDGRDMYKGDSVQIGLNVPEQDGFFELLVTRADGGGARKSSMKSPKGFKGGEVFNAMKVATKRQGDLTIYDVRVPLKALGLDAAALKRGIGFSFVVNDLDEAGAKTREGYLQLSRGIADAKDATHFPIMVAD